MNKLPNDAFEEWQPSEPMWVAFDLPSNIMERLRVRALAAGHKHPDGSARIYGLLHEAWRRHGDGAVCTAALDALAADGSDPDMQQLQRAAIRAAMERDRPN